MNLLIDTNCLIYFFYGKHEAFASWFVNIEAQNIFVSSLTIFELLKGFGYIESKKGMEYVNDIAKTYKILDFTLEDAREASKIYDNLKKSGNRNDSLDVLLASQAINHKLTLTTFNYQDFEKIGKLKLKKFYFETAPKK
ncbi:type II toxin-antitoxin system VapC family toxin [Scytonema sp. PRP1]|uniref:type II toxin-antitoxin system VapC family toxin n=1 Tax=Scytonema sp. PRP1 TaxID=3120513 RepID=UPI00300D40B0